MAFTAVTTLNDSYEVAGAGMQAFLFAYPSGGYTGTTAALKIANLYTNIYTNGTTKTPLTASQWAGWDENGLQVKAKTNTVEVEKMNGPKHPIGIASFEATIEGTLVDIDAAHLGNMSSVTSGEILTTAAGTGQYGSTVTLVGSQKTIRQYGLIIRVPSPVVTTGTVTAYDHLVFPKVVIVPELDLKYSKKDPLKAKVQFTALTDSTLVSPDNGQPILFFLDQATAAAS